MKIENQTELIIMKNILSNILKVPLPNEGNYGDLSYTYLNEIIEDKIVLTEEQFLESVKQIELLLIKAMLAEIFKESVTANYFIECVCYKFFCLYFKGLKSEEQFENFSQQTNEPERIKTILFQIAESYKNMLMITV